MAIEYSVDICRELEERFRAADLHRPMRIRRYEPGTELAYDVTGVVPANKGQVRLRVEKFVGGGFAGQVYRVKLLDIETVDGPIAGLQTGGHFAMKILLPASGFGGLFRNLIYWVGFGGPFQLQVNPAAVRAGALWQKFIRRAAERHFGDRGCLVDVLATFVDSNIGSCGELSQWVDGRTWRLEVDDRMDHLKRWRKGKSVDAKQLGSPEYRAKRQFMAQLAGLLHEMGAAELARQYEWFTCKSQPNCLKRAGTEDDPSGGLVAVDFRAGLALLPFLPMSPVDVLLICKGIGRGSVVQFDRGDLGKLRRFIETHSNDFTGMDEALKELADAERTYRNSVPDITHNHVRLLYSRQLWSTITNSAVTGWKIRNITDDSSTAKLRRNRLFILVFFAIGLVPLLGSFVRRLWGRAEYRRHYKEMLTSWDYLCRAVCARVAEKVIGWHRAGRVGERRALKLAEQPWRFFGHLPLLVLPVKLHRFFTDWQYAAESLDFIFVRPLRLYFNASAREQWLKQMVGEGQKNHILTDEDAEVILSQLKEPFIQKYLKSLAVHVCTLPVTQIVSVIVAWIYVKLHPEMSAAQAAGAAAGILVLFQITPLSPGSLVRGFYVLYMVIRERDFKNYNVAVFLGFFKYIGYLAFPIQMAYHYPALARFMAAHWATSVVHIVPVFGERGALLEHWVFCLFYNWPLTIRRRMCRRSEMRMSMKPRYWHVAGYVFAATLIFGIVDFAYLENAGALPGLKEIWWLVVGVPLICGWGVTLGCGGATLGKRISAATICGVVVGLLYTGVSAALSLSAGFGAENVAINCLWRVFIFAVLSAIGAIATELELPEPNLE